MTKEQKAEIKSILERLIELVDSIEVEQKVPVLAGKLSKIAYEHGFEINSSGYVDLVKTDVKKIFSDELDDKEFYSNYEIFKQCYNTAIANMDKAKYLTEDVKNSLMKNYREKADYAKGMCIKRAERKKAQDDEDVVCADFD